MDTAWPEWRRFAVDGGALRAAVLGDVRGEPEVADVRDEPAGVAALVTGHGATTA
jgi:hypothetical protein